MMKQITSLIKKWPARWLSLAGIFFLTIALISSCNKVKEVDLGKQWIVSTFVGAGATGYADGKGVLSAFNNPNGLATDAVGNIFVADSRNFCVRKITPDGVVTTLAGAAGQYDYVDATGSEARFSTLTGIAVDASGNIYVEDAGNNVIRKITQAGIVTTLAGDGNWGFADGPGTIAEFRYPNDMAIDASNNLYVTDYNNDCIRKITPDGMVSTILSNPLGSSYITQDGPLATASTHYPTAIAI